MVAVYFARSTIKQQMALITPESSEYEAVISSVANAARDGYIDLPYHNWEHAVRVTLESRRLVSNCHSNGIELDQFVTDASGLIHDYDFHKPLNTKVVRSRELRSSRAAGIILRSHGIDSRQIEHVQACIRSTEVGKRCLSNEAKAVRRADLMNVSGDYVSFINNSWKLFKESHQVSGVTAPLLAWLDKSKQILTTYIDEDVRFEFEKKEGALYLFKQAAIRNITKLSNETEEEFIKKNT